MRTCSETLEEAQGLIEAVPRSRLSGCLPRLGATVGLVLGGRKEEVTLHGQCDFTVMSATGLGLVGVRGGGFGAHSQTQ